jgi:hypothetical protein
MNLRFVTSLYNKHDNLPLSSLIFILTIVFLFLQHLKIDVILSIDLRHLQPLEHPCANSYNPHVPSIRNNPRTCAKSLERIVLKAADPTNEAAVKATLSEHRRLRRKARTRKMLVERVHHQTPVTTATSEESSTGTLLIGIEDAFSPPPPFPSAARKRTGKKPALAYHFCRGRKIAYGSSRSGEGNETCK